MESKKYNCLIYGATGATGRMVTKHCMQSDRWDQVFIIVRRSLPIYDELKAAPNGDSLHVIMSEDIMDEDKVLEAKGSTQIHCVFNLLGSRVGRGKELFIQIDKTFVVQSCVFAQKLNALLFSHITSEGSNKDSWFLYMRVKGECEEELKKAEMKHVSILRPGAILDRENDQRCGEKMSSCIPFMPKIKADDLAKATMLNAVKRMDVISSGQPIEGETSIIYKNKEILAMLED